MVVIHKASSWQKKKIAVIEEVIGSDIVSKFTIEVISLGKEYVKTVEFPGYNIRGLSLAQRMKKVVPWEIETGRLRHQDYLEHHYFRVVSICPVSAFPEDTITQ